ncbi:MAG: hypothetical protein IJT33_07090 [Campylobacter sp.]|nr:hypothetical protein [Campylobacter sp.]MBQ7676204.1 hypothetical protein [Campylobacter sp.]MBQ9875738.1 hypothetical protein [Campylobacter sp.]MBR0071577.1 hypothetical protein [Campylobacter sp.]
MNDYVKSVFGDPARLREKLEIYLHTPQKVEIYAKAAENFFKLGKGKKLAFTPTWSWWGFGGGFLFFMYRKDYLATLVWFIVSLFASVFAAPFTAMFAKFSVISRFASILSAGNDEFLSSQGGVNRLAIWLYVIFAIIFLFVAVSAYLGYISYTVKFRY